VIAQPAAPTPTTSCQRLCLKIVLLGSGSLPVACAASYFSNTSTFWFSASVFVLSLLLQPEKRSDYTQYSTTQYQILGYIINFFVESMSTFQVHTANPGNKTCTERSQYTRENAWENLKNDVKHLYVTERLDLREVQVRLRSQGKYNFEAT
jgi:hypothetical protein